MTGMAQGETFKNVGAARKVILDPLEVQLLVDACGPGCASWSWSARRPARASAS